MTNRPSEFTGRNLRRSLQLLLIPGVSLNRWLAIGSIAGAAVAVAAASVAAAAAAGAAGGSKL